MELIIQDKKDTEINDCKVRQTRDLNFSNSTKCSHNTSTKFDTFLKSLYSEFSKYRIQRNPDRFNVKNLDDWGAKGHLQGIEITNKNFQHFLSKIEKYNVTELDSMKNTKLTNDQLLKLNQVLDYTIKHRVKIECMPTHILISGHFISIRNLKKLIYTDFICDHSLKRNSLTIRIYALNTIFIDSDISHQVSIFLERSIPFVFMAPEWMVISNNATIDLSGSDVHVSHDRLLSYLTKKGHNETIDGMPGLPGGPGGIFFGIADKIVHNKRLVLNVSGGPGGSGQNGKDGLNGTNGLNIQKTECLHFCDVNGGKNLCNQSCKSTHKRGPDVMCKFLIKNNINGTKGEDGGNGGVGGLGGYSGLATIIPLSGPNHFKVLKERGKNGIDGKGGHGGVGGVEQKAFDGFCTYKKDGGQITNFTIREFDSTVPPRRAQNGTYGRNAVNLLNLKPLEVNDDLYKADIINEYKFFFRQSFINSTLIFTDPEFLIRMDKNDIVKEFYGTLDFAVELKKLELQSSTFKGSDGIFYPFYQSLLNRIYEFAERPESLENSYEYKRLLNFLYIATLSRKSNMKSRLETNLIINISEYLKKLKDEFLEFKDLYKIESSAKEIKTKRKNIVEKINEYKNEYKKRILDRISEALKVVDLIKSEFKNFTKEIDAKMDFYLTEIQTSKTNAEESGKKLKEQKEQLKSTTWSKCVATLIDTACNIAMMFGPSSVLTGLTVKIPLAIKGIFFDAEKWSDQKSSLKQLESDLTKGVQSLSFKLNTEMSIRKDNFKKLIDDIAKEINKDDSEDFQELSDYITKTKARYEKEDIRYKHVIEMETELKQSFQSEYEKFRTSTTKKSEGAVRILSEVERMTRVGISLPETYFKYREQSDKLDKLSETIAENEKNIEKLKLLEKSIHTDITPKLQELVQALENIAGNIGMKSKTDLDIYRLHIENIFDNTTQFLRDNIGEFKVKNQLLNFVTKIKNIIPILINTNSQIQEWQDHLISSEYMANLNSASYIDTTNDKDHEFDDLISHLNMMFHSNMMLQRYKMAMKTFQQFVFPFAEHYSKRLELPEHLQLQKSIPELVDDVLTQIKGILSELESYKMEIKNPFDKVARGDFNSRNPSTEPFFIWENEEYNHDISRLLSGKEVVLNADVAKALPDHDAIKFNLIELYFKAHNESNQPSIDGILNYFKIELTHLGHSYYTYNSKTYILETPNITMWYYFDKNDKKEPTHSSGTYRAVRDGDYMLSPFALWKFKLDYVSKKNRTVTFESLAEFKDEIDLELGGRATYAENCDFDIDKYYKSLETCGVILSEDRFSRRKRYNSSLANSLRFKNYRNNGFSQSLGVHNNSRRKPDKKNKDSLLQESTNFGLLPGADAATQDPNLMIEILQKYIFSKNLEKDNIFRLNYANNFILNEDIVPENFRNGFSSDFYLGNKIVDTVSSIVNSIKTFVEYSTTFKFMSIFTQNNVNFDKNSKLKSNIETIYHPESVNEEPVKLEIDFHEANSNDTFFQSKMEINSCNDKLLLVQFFASLKFGANKSLKSSYISPEQYQKLHLNTLSCDILPHLETKSFEIDSFIQNYENASAWYKDIFKKDVEEIINKRNTRKY